MRARMVDKKMAQRDHAWRGSEGGMYRELGLG